MVGTGLRWMMAVGALASVAGAGWILSSRPPEARSGRAAESRARAEVKVQGVHMVETREGAPLWEARAARAEVFEGEGLTRLYRGPDQVEVTLFSDKGRVTAWANQATVDLKTKDLLLEGDVRARSDQGISLETARLTWRAGERRLVTDRPVVVRRGGLVSTAQGMEAEPPMERVLLMGKVESLVGPGSLRPSP